MIQFDELETAFRVTVNGDAFLLSEQDVDMVYYETKDLILDERAGSAPVSLGDNTVILEAEDWGQLFLIAREYFFMSAAIAEAEMNAANPGAEVAQRLH